MRVVLIADRFPLASETFFVQRFMRLLERGIDMHVVCNSSRADDWAYFPELSAIPDARDRVHVRGPSGRRGVLVAPFVLVRTVVSSPKASFRHLALGMRSIGPRAVRRLYRDAELVRLRPDVVHFTFGAYARNNSYLGAALRCATVVSFQGADLNYAGLDQGDAFYADVFRTVDAIHFQGADLARRATRRGYTPDERAVVIKPGVDPAAFEPPVRTPHGGPIRILSIGRLHWKKGYDDALHAIRMVVDEGIDVRYRIIGDGEGRDAVLYDRHDLGLEDVVELLGPQPASRVRDELAETDIFLHAATSEGFCYAVIEAQAMKVPVVTSDADGLAENVADGETGYVVPRRNPAELAVGIVKLARDPDLRARMGEAGRARVLSEFAPDAETAAYEALYRNTAARRDR